MKDNVSIMLIDRDSAVLDSFASLFIEEGYQVNKAMSWFEAKSIIKMKPVNIIIADVKLSDISYQEMIEKIREDNKYAFIITTAGFSDIEMAIESIQLGAHDYLSKPFDPSDTIVLVRKLVEKQRLQSDNIQLFDTIKVLAMALDARDNYTHNHSQEVMEYSVAIAREMGLSVREIEIIRDAGALHDIGKIGIPDAVLLKPGRLTDEEYEQIKKHPEIGKSILEPVKCLADNIPLIYHHHERIDGTGYPAGLAGEAIPLGARILAVADSYQAMTSDRPYRKALSMQIAIGELEKFKDRQFDSKVVDVFLRILKRMGNGNTNKT